MLAVLQFVFSSFWIFAGTVVLIYTLGICLTAGFFAYMVTRQRHNTSVSEKP